MAAAPPFTALDPDVIAVRVPVMFEDRTSEALLAGLPIICGAGVVGPAIVGVTTLLSAGGTLPIAALPC